VNQSQEFGQVRGLNNAKEEESEELTEPSDLTGPGPEGVG